LAPRIEFAQTRTDSAEQQRIRVAVEGVLPAGNWRVNLVGAHENDVWEMHVWGAGIDFTVNLEGGEGKHSPGHIAEALTDTIMLNTPKSGNWLLVRRPKRTPRHNG
jgi:hypothetical protein